MSGTKFTKGEWVADVRVGCCAVYALESRDDWEQGLHDDERNIFYQSYPNAAMKPGLSGDSVEKIANAHLIAAAPKMYEMLESIVITEQMNGDDAFSGLIIELLAEARGEQC